MRNKKGQFLKGLIPKSKINLNQDQIKTIKEMYLEKKMSCTEISEIFGYSSNFVCDKLNEWKIMRSFSDARKIYFNKHQPWNKGRKFPKIKVDKDLLHKLYVEQKKTMIETSRALGIPVSTIRLRLIEYGWGRSVSEALVGHKIDEEVKKKISESLKNNFPNRWNNNELSILFDIYEKNKKAFILKQLPNKSWESIKYKAKELKLKRSQLPVWNKGKIFLPLDKNGNWKGGKPKCKYCQKEITYGAKTCSNCFIEKEGKMAWQKKPTSIEIKMRVILDKHFPNEWKYVGNGDVWMGRKNPDFININGKKKIIEVYGDYWHKGEDPQERIEHFKRYGFETLIVWGKEFKNEHRVLELVRKEFYNVANS